MQRFVKYCKKEHNIQFGCPTIQLGSFQHYRNMENLKSSLADKDEGKEVTFVSDYDSEKSSGQTKRQLGRFIGGNGKVKIRNSVLERMYPNCIIFCVSSDPGYDYIQHAKEFDEKYDSFYIIDNINIFIQKLANLIVENFEISWFHSSFHENLKRFTLIDFQQIQIQFIQKPIIYVKSKNETINDSEITKNNPVMNEFDRLVFTKDQKYKDQREYRILFQFVHPRHGIIPVREEPIILPVSPILRELLNHSPSK